jgi:hypothetical protein
MFSEADATLAKSLARLAAADDWEGARKVAAQHLAADRSIVLARGNSLGHWHGFTLELARDALRFQFADPVTTPRTGEALFYRWAQTFPLMAHFAASEPDAVGSIDVNLGDAPDRQGLAFCDCRPGATLIPDTEFLVTKGYETFRRHFSSHPISWSSRRPLAYWRGSTTGAPLDPEIGWKTLPRILLCEFALSAPNLFDVGVTRIVDIHEDPEAVRNYLQSKGFIRSPAPQEAVQQFKYQIDIDGHTNSWSGLFIKLLTGSPVLKITSRLGWRQWYYDRMKPWEHFVPVEMSREDLLEKVHWLRGHDDTAERIGRAGRALAGSMTFEAELAEAARAMRRALHPISSE